MTRLNAKHLLAGAALLAIGAAMPALGKQKSAAKDPNDPNRIVCERVETIGTRLNAKKVCKPAKDWDAEKSTNRQAVEKNQVQRGKSN